MSDKTKWPPEIALKPSKETTEESKHTRQVQALVTASPQRNEFDELLESYRLRKVLRIGAWIQRFTRNCRRPSADREYGPLKSNEIEHQKTWWIKRVQQVVVLDVEVALNNRPLSYIEEDVELPVVTPNSMLNINPSVLPELKSHHIDNRDLRIGSVRSL